MNSVRIRCLVAILLGAGAIIVGTQFPKLLIYCVLPGAFIVIAGGIGLLLGGQAKAKRDKQEKQEKQQDPAKPEKQEESGT